MYPEPLNGEIPQCTASHLGLAKVVVCVCVLEQRGSVVTDLSRTLLCCIVYSRTAWFCSRTNVYCHRARYLRNVVLCAALLELCGSRLVVCLF